MAGSPRFKVHNPQGEYIASCKHAEDAAALVANYGDGAKIKDSGMVVWHEGREDFPAAESFDGVAYTMAARVFEKAAKTYGANAQTMRGRGHEKSAADYQLFADEAAATAARYRSKLSGVAQ